MGKPKKKVGGEAMKEESRENNVEGGAEGLAAAAPAARKRGRPRKVVVQAVQEVEEAMKAEDMKSTSSWKEEEEEGGDVVGVQEAGAESKSKSKSKKQIQESSDLPAFAPPPLGPFISSSRRDGSRRKSEPKRAAH